MNKNEVLKILETAKDKNGKVPMRLVRQAFEKLPEPCEDTISRQPERLTDDDFETIRIHLNAYKEKLCNQHRYEEAEEYQRIIDRFMAFASAQTEQWIPCSERMPDDYTDVLAWFEYYRYGNYNRMYQTYGIGTYSGKYASWMINHETGWQRLKVIAWMPLPEPYTGGWPTIGVCSTCRHADISDAPRTIRTGNVVVHQEGRQNINCTCDRPKSIGFSDGEMYCTAWEAKELK